MHKRIVKKKVIITKMNRLNLKKTAKKIKYWRKKKKTMRLQGLKKNDLNLRFAEVIKY